MTKVTVNSGACGFTVTITAEKGKDKKILIALDTACEMVQKMLADIARVDHRVTLTGFRDNRSTCQRRNISNTLPVRCLPPFSRPSRRKRE